MLNIFLTLNKKQGVWLELPCSPVQTEEAIRALEGRNFIDVIIRIADAASSVPNLPEYLRNVTLNDQVMKELQFLSRRINGMTEHEQAMLGAALEIEEPNSLMEIVNLSCNMDKFAVYPDAHNEAELGQYLFQQRKINIPEELRPYVDYELIGGGYVNDHAGCFSECGYVFRTGEALEEVYDFRRLPDPAYEKNGFFLLQIYNGKPNGSYSISLPTSQEKLDLLKNNLGITDFNDNMNFCLNCSIQGLKERLPCGSSVQELNEFAKLLQGGILDGTEETRIHLLAALEAEAPDNMDFAAEIAVNLDLYDFVADMEKIHTPADYAYYFIENQGLLIPDEAVDFIDYDAMGKALLHDYGYTQTSFGPVSRADRSIRQLPDELTTLRLFSPLTAVVYEHNESGEMEWELPIPKNVEDICAHKNMILSLIEQEHLNTEGDRGLAVYLDNVLLGRKVYSMKPTVEEWEGELWGVLEVQTHGELSVGEMKELISQWEGQCSDGWGESFEQRSIDIGDGDLYVSFWHSGRDFFIMPESELKGKQMQVFGMQMGGM
ncbi:antirestriction protein ArdA [Hungatella effluvii]|uniref:antirestriction protein ArdA n=1 Tax=Hungatella effluvii TaxID=1096246 RepID=UPI0022E245B2|nr:antirestriction protein ArdA [Hungatella effluvii]